MERCQKVADRHFPLFLMSNPIRRFLFPPTKLVSKYVSKGMVVADVGCGPGHFTLPMSEIVGEQGKVYAVDSDAKSIKALTSKATRRGYNNVESRVSSAANLDFIPSGSVDFVFAHGLLCCMRDHAGAVKEMTRILKPDGSAYLSVSRKFRKKDEKQVSREEWQRILDGFNLLRKGGGLVMRWAHVVLKARISFLSP